MLEWISTVFGVHVMAEASYCVLDRGPRSGFGHRTRHPQRWDITLRKLLALATSQLVIPVVTELLSGLSLT